MNVLTILLISSLGIAMLMTGILLVNALWQNFKTGNLVRIKLAEKFEQLRIGKMLKKTSVDINQLLHTTPLIEIENEIKNCRACKQTTECDSILEKEDFEYKEMDFCPNQDLIISKKS